MLYSIRKSFGLAIGLMMVLGILLCQAAPIQAQLWSGILDPSRATDWTQAGVPGGIPNRTTQCGSTIAAYTGTAATINTAIQNCHAQGGGVVQLAAGTFHLSTGITFTPGGTAAKDVTLRGAGPDQTTVQAEGAFAGCAYASAIVCVGDASGWLGGWPGNTANWTAGFTEGTTQITLSNTTNMTPGVLIWLDQLNAPLGDFTRYVPIPVESATYSLTPLCQQQTNRCVWEMHTVTAVNGTIATITPPIAYHAWNAHGNDQPVARWHNNVTGVPSGVGVENMTINNNAGASVNYGFVQFHGARNSWAKNIRGINGSNAAVLVKYSANVEIRDSYWFFQLNPNTCLSAGTQYGMDAESSSFVKIENNIFQQQCTSLMLHSCSACVVGYNFTVGDLTVNNQGEAFGWAMFIGHSGGTHSTLFEGNISNGLSPDHQVAHGANSGFFVAFRNYLSGQQVPGSTVYSYPAFHQGYNRMSSWIGNVLGNSASSSWSYQSVPGSYRSLASWSIGMGCGQNPSGSCSIPDDPITTNSLMRWGNYDYATRTSRFVAAEVPSPGIAPYTQFVPASQALPNSFYLLTKRSWFGSSPWPVIGPDVTGGYDASGHVGSIPARNCYLNVMRGPMNGSGGVLIFNAANCYGSTTDDQSSPAAPVGLRVM